MPPSGGLLTDPLEVFPRPRVDVEIIVFLDKEGNFYFKAVFEFGRLEDVGCGVAFYAGSGFRYSEFNL